MTGVLGAVHNKLVFGRRVRVLADLLTPLISDGARVLDIGCGDGTIDSLILQHRADATIEGIDVLVRPSACISVRPFDGTRIPYPDSSFDLALLVDVLHHTPDPSVLLREAARVAKSILLKDHFKEGFLAGPTLRFMDWIGNKPHGVVLPYNYWTQSQWKAAFATLGLQVIDIKTSLGLYHPPASWLFGRNLHFIALLEPARGVFPT